ncbi:MAG: TauD/TfdA family dioxygenase [Novosphingobium sp.]|nr:TauD/TfdA family dioxygenase [Novosphingobium sp.]
MTSIRIRNLPGDFNFGARVDGVTWDNLYDEDLRAQLNQLFEDRGVIIFENMEPSSKMQVELSKVFGPLKDHPTKTVPRAADDIEEGVIDMHRLPEEVDESLHGVTVVNGEPQVAFIPWHFDHTYNDELNRAGVLRSVVSAPERGRTGFADGVELYKDFDPDLLARIEGLNAIYTLDTRLTQQRFGRTFEIKGDLPMMAPTVLEAAIFPRAMHPMVWTRDSGEKVVHVSGFSAAGIEHHEDPEGDALFEEVCQEVIRKAHGYFHDWKPTDMVIWDNWRVMHSVEGCDPKYERRMHRTTIKGDYGLGYFEDGKKIGEVNRAIAPLDLPA